MFGICNEPGVLSILMLVKTFINIIKIAAPLTLIITGSITFMKAVAGNEDDIKKSKKIFTNKLVAAAVLFLVPTILTLVISFIGEDSNSFMACINNASVEGIKASYVYKAEQKLEDAKKTFSKKDYQDAKLAINKLEDEDKKNQMLSELSTIENYIVLMDDIKNLEDDYSYEKYKEIKKEVETIEDEVVKNRVQTKFDEVVKTLFAFIGNYPIVPFGEHELYTGLKTYKGDSLDNLLKKNGSSAEELNQKIKMAVEYYGVGTRKATVAAAITLIGSIAETGYQLPYFWGGKHSHLGVNPNWGTPALATSCRPPFKNTQEEIDACIARNGHLALDCSGFVNWAIIQGVQEVRTQEQTNTGKRIKLGANTADHAVCDIGDALDLPGEHIALIVRLDDENKRYIIAEESMGLEIDSIPYSGPVGQAYDCVKIDEYID